MRRFVLALTLAATVPASTLRADDIVLGRFAAYLESLRLQAGIPGMAVAIVGRSSLQWSQALGQQDTARRIATRTDTPFHLDGLTEIFTASLVLRCVEEGHFTLDESMGPVDSGTPTSATSLRQILTHTSGNADDLFYSYQPERFAPLGPALRRCTDDSYRETLGNLLDRLAMADSVPGPDAILLQPPDPGIPDPAAMARYTGVLARLATPYAVDQRGRATASQYGSQTLTPTSGLVSTVLDYAKFDLALKSGVVLRPETLSEAWTVPRGRNGAPLPHGMGWFVQAYNGETIAWNFGVSENASSSLVVMLPARGITLVMLANSSGLVGTGRPFTLANGDLMASPFVRLFLGLFAA